MRKSYIYSLLFANILITLTFWWLGSGSLMHDTNGILIATGRLMGLLLQLAILTELILIGRIKFVEQAFGFDKLNMLHRKIGYSIGGFMLLHPLLLTVGYAREHGVSLIAQFADFVNNYEDVLRASLAFWIIVLVVIISLPAVRKLMRYETWHVLHLPMYVAIVLAFGHQTKTADVSFGQAFYYWYALNFTVFGALLFYRALTPILNYHKHKFVIDKVEQETSTVTNIYITGKHMSEFVWSGGQYVHAFFLTSGMWQPHPFSISCAHNGKYLRLSIKSSGDYTSKVAGLKSGTRVLLEGPFGKFTTTGDPATKYLFLAGGIGITPIRAMIEELAISKADMILLYANRKQEDKALHKELATLIPRTTHILSAEKTAPPNHELGYIDEEKLTRLVPDVSEREVYLCGPKPMMDAILSILTHLCVPKKQIHFEVFSY